MTTVGQRESPRLLLHGFDDTVADQLRELVPTIERVDHLGNEYIGDWDLVVSDQSLEGTESVFGIGFGCKHFGEVIEEIPRGPLHIVHELVTFGSTVARELDIPEDTPAQFMSLLQERLGPACNKLDQKPVMEFGGMHQGRGSRPSDVVAPLLVTREPKWVAVQVFRLNSTEALCLPEVAKPDVVRWVEAALSYWRVADPERFPTPDEWVESDDWLTVEEEELVHALRGIDVRQEEILEGIELERADINEKLAKAKAAAEQGPKALLSGGDDALVDAVSAVLTALGFKVENRDLVNTTSRREDLWVTDDTEPGWLALVEVHSYAKGAQQRDLMRLMGLFTRAFMLDQGREPSALWLVVNHFSGDDPSTREKPFERNPKDVEVFVEANGLVIDSPTLFRLAKAIQRGEVDRDALRAELRSSTGVWSWPTENPET